MIDNLEDFERYILKYNMYPGGFGNRLSKVPNSSQLISKFNSYLKREKAKTKIQPFSSRDTKWLDVKKEVIILDEGECQLLESLRLISVEDPDFLPIYNNAKVQYNPGNNYDPAHILSRGSTPQLKYDSENIVTLKRIFHSRIDFGRNPVTGELCSKEEIRDWWDLILEARSYKLGKVFNIDYLKSKTIK